MSRLAGSMARVISSEEAGGLAWHCRAQWVNSRAAKRCNLVRLKPEDVDAGQCRFRQNGTPFS